MCVYHCHSRPTLLIARVSCSATHLFVGHNHHAKVRSGVFTWWIRAMPILRYVICAVSVIAAIIHQADPPLAQRTPTSNADRTAKEHHISTALSPKQCINQIKNRFCEAQAQSHAMRDVGHGQDLDHTINQTQSTTRQDITSIDSFTFQATRLLDSPSHFLSTKDSHTTCSESDSRKSHSACKRPSPETHWRSTAATSGSARERVQSRHVGFCSWKVTKGSAHARPCRAPHIIRFASGPCP